MTRCLGVLAALPALALACPGVALAAASPAPAPAAGAPGASGTNGSAAGVTSPAPVAVFRNGLRTVSTCGLTALAGDGRREIAAATDVASGSDTCASAAATLSTTSPASLGATTAVVQGTVTATYVSTAVPSGAEYDVRGHCPVEVEPDPTFDMLSVSPVVTNQTIDLSHTDLADRATGEFRIRYRFFASTGSTHQARIVCSLARSPNGTDGEQIGISDFTTVTTTDAPATFTVSPAPWKEGDPLTMTETCPDGYLAPRLFANTVDWEQQYGIHHYYDNWEPWYPWVFLYGDVSRTVTIDVPPITGTATELWLSGACEARDNSSYAYARPSLFTGRIQAATCPAGTPMSGQLRRKGDADCDGRVRVAIVGDSYISGEGAADAVTQEDPNEPTWGYEEGTDQATNKCHRSHASWAYRVASTLATEPADEIGFFACSGARTADIVARAQYPNSPPAVPGWRRQIDELEDFDLDGTTTRGNADLVLLSIGGNDVGFSEIIKDCLGGYCAWNADNIYLPRSEKIRAALRYTFDKVASIAPNAEIWDVGYMAPMNGSECRATGFGFVATWLPSFMRLNADKIGSIDRPEQQYFVNRFLPELNRVLAEESATTGLRFFDVKWAFAGHYLCSDVPYVNGIKGGDDNLHMIGNESFHPNPMGHREVARTFAWYVSQPGFARHPAYSGRIPSPAVTPPIPVTTATSPTQSQETAPLLQPAGQVQIQGTGAIPSQPLKVVIRSVPQLLGEVVPDETGAYDVTLDLPGFIGPGIHTIALLDASGATVSTELVTVDAIEGCVPLDSDTDFDGDLRPDRCDPDSTDGPDADVDGDGVSNAADNCIASPNMDQVDANANGVGDVCDPTRGGSLLEGVRPAGWEPPPDTNGPTLTIGGVPDQVNKDASINVTVAAYDPSGVRSLACTYDGATAPCPATFHRDGVGEGPHLLAIRAVDPHDNASVRTIGWTTDRTAPTVDVVGVPAVVTRATVATIRVSVADASTVVTGSCTVDGAAYPCDAPIALTGLVSGRHSLRVTATDAASNTTTFAGSWTIDARAPSVPSVQLLPIARTSTVTARWTARDDRTARGRLAYDVRVTGAGPDGAFGPWAAVRRPAATESRTVDAGADGRTSCVSVRAVDEVGNRSAWSRPACTTRPLDSAGLRRGQGWRLRRSQRFYAGSALEAVRRGRVLTLPLTVKVARIALLASRCASCGRVQVSVGGASYGVAGLRARTPRPSVVVWLPARAARGGGVSVRTTTAARVRIDALVIVPPAPAAPRG